MKTVCYSIIVMFLAVAICISGCSHLQIQEDRDVLFQTSTIDALREGVYDGKVSYKELRRYGNFGIGTFDEFDGEMTALGGKFYQIRADGIAYPVDDSMKAPFAMVTFFEPDEHMLLDEAMDYEHLKQYLDDYIVGKNVFCAIKIEGAFEYVKTRSVPKQTKPYPKLSDVLKNQVTFEFHNVKGTMVGFWCPLFAEGVNVPGYHFHFITDGGGAGGHLLDCKLENARIGVDYTSEFHMVLLESDDFQ